LAELTRRYFTGHGPATLPDFVWWSGLTVNDARRGIALANAHINEIQFEGNTYWTSDSTPTSASNYKAHLLPVYDEYNVAYKDRRLVIDPASGLTTWDALGPVVVVDGKLVGTWKATLDKHSVTIAVNSATTFAKHEKLAITKAAERYATFLDLSLKLSFA
jgi:hypothetical protein